MAGHYVLKFENENKLSKFLCDIESNLVMRYSDWAIDRSLKSIFTVLDNRISAFYFDIT